MKRRRLALQHIEVGRMPGFRVQGFSVQGLSPGVNVIHGPNASGKTTLAQAVRAALWSERAPAGAGVRLDLALDDEAWSAEHEGGRTRWRRGASDTAAPALPEAGASDRYVLCLHEMLAVDDAADRFAQAVLQESTGGYSVQEAADGLGFRAQPPRRHNDSKKVNRAAEAKHDALARQKEIQQQEHELGDLRRRHGRATEAVRRAGLLQLAREHAEARDEHERCDQRLQGFPEVLEKARGDEPQRLRETEELLKRQDGQIENAETALREAERDLDAVALPETGVEPTTLDTLTKAVVALRETEHEIKQGEKEIARQRTHLESAREAVGEGLQEEVLKRLDTKKWNDLAGFAQKWETTTNRLRQLEAEAELLRCDPPQDTDELRRAVDALRAWLRESGQGAGAQPARTPLLVTGAIGTAVAVAAALLVHLAFLVPAIVAVAATLWGLRPAAPESVDRRATLQEIFRETRLDPPDHWEPDAVRKRLLAIETALVDALSRSERGRRRQQVEQEIKRLQEQRTELETQRKGYQTTIGPAPGDDPRTLLWVLNRALAWREAHDRLQATRSGHDVLVADRDRLLEKIGRPLKAYGYHEAADANEAESQVSDLKDRTARLREALAKKRQAQTQRARAEEERARLDRERTGVFRRFGLRAGDDQALEDLLAHHEQYLEVKKETERLRILKNDALHRLEKHGFYEESLRDGNVQELEKEHAAALEEAANAQTLHKRIVEIEKSVQDAKEDTRVQQALHGYDEARRKLAEAFTQDAGDLVGHLLARGVHEVSRDQDRPRVFHRARDLLLEFTRGQFHLEFDDAREPTFRARDTQTGRVHGPGELSSGSRMQLLLAVRIAFVEQLESDIALPVILDETLANSDDIRAGAIIDSVIALARSGRQVFYLTAQGDEVAKWKARLERADDVPHAVVDLAEARALTQAADVPSIETAPMINTHVPGPDGASHDSYAEVLKVPPFDPRQDVGAVHLWYVVEDVHLLHRLLREGLSTCGQLGALRSNNVPLGRPEDEGPLRCAEVYAQALDAYARAWLVGRGRPVDRGVLQASGAVTQNFIDPLSRIADACARQAKEILAAIDGKQVPGFRTTKRDELATYLEENGYLDPNPPLSAKEIQMRVLTAVAQPLQDDMITKTDVDRLLGRLAHRAQIAATA